VAEPHVLALNTRITSEIIMKKFIALGAAATLLTLAAGSAMAGGVNWSVNLGLGGYYPPAPVYYGPPPVYNNYPNYYAPPVVYGSPVPVYQAPAPVYYEAPVVVYQRRDYRGPHHDYRRGGYDRGYREYRDYRR
jgi:hypothetical protein